MSRDFDGGMRRILLLVGWVHAATRLRLWVWALAFLPPNALAIFWKESYSGPQRWLAEWELRRFDAYYPTLTGALVAGIASVLWAIPVLAVGVAWVLRRDTAEAAASAAPVSPAAPAAPLDAVERRVARVMGALVGGAALVAGAVLWFQAARAGPLREIDAGQLERGEDPGGTYLRLAGKPELDRAVVVKQRGSDRWEMKTYVPVVSSEWSPDEPVAAFVTGPSWRFDPMMGAVDPVGMVSASGLDVAATFFQQNGLRVASRTWVIELGKNPRDTLRPAQALVGAALPIGLLTWWFMGRRGRRARRR